MDKEDNSKVKRDAKGRIIIAENVPIVFTSSIESNENE